MPQACPVWYSWYTARPRQDLHLLLRRFSIQSVKFHLSTNTEPQIRCIQEHIDRLFLLQNMIPAPSNDDAVTLLCNLADHIAFQLKQLVIQCNSGKNPLVQRLSLQIAAGTSLIVLHRIRQIQISASGSLRNQIFIIKWDL